MSQKFLTIEARFQLKGRGLLVVPGPLLEDFSGPATLAAELRKPDGTTRAAELSIIYIFIKPPPRERRWACILKGLRKDDVPIGTEVWLHEAI